MYDKKFDTHKLMYHPDRVAEWLNKGFTKGPLYTEFELTSKCNCNCIFCGVDYCVNKGRGPIAKEDALKIIRDLKKCGNRSIMFAGHGESLLNADSKEIISSASTLMSASVTTNGIALDENNISIINKLKWIRFSINGTNKKNYNMIHNSNSFDKVIENLKNCVSHKKKMNSKVTIGTQLVLLDENRENIVNLAETLKSCGADYFSIKPYSKHPLSKNSLSPDYSDIDNLSKSLLHLENDTFKIIFRTESFKSLNKSKTYEKCFGTHFISFIDANGDVWECNIFAEDKRFWIGNALKTPFEKIWNGPKRKEVLNFISQDLNLSECRDLCRMENCNIYLNRLKNPYDHDDFI